MLVTWTERRDLTVKVDVKPRSHRTNGVVAFPERWKSPLVTVQQTLATVKETPYTLGHRLWSLLPLRKFLATQNIANGEKGSIFRSGKVHRRYNNAKSTFVTARRKFADAWDR